MASGGGDDGARKPPDSPEARARLDRRAEALRANLRRRKAQTRARDEVGRADGPPPGQAGRDG